MSESNIEWTGKVWNPTTGCNKVSAGCKNCYAEGMHARLMYMHPEKYARPFLDGAFAHEPSLVLPLSWKKPTTIFVNSMSDLFHKNISVEYIAKVYAVMFLTPRHTYQLLTKRPERRLEVFKSALFFEYLHKYYNQYQAEFIKPSGHKPYTLDDIKKHFPFNNIWEGTSAESQATANERIPILLRTSAAIRWVSAEPLLEPVDFTAAVNAATASGDIIQNLWGLDWIVVGGESGSKRRTFDTDWARQIREYCKNTSTKFFMKQVDKVRAIPDDLLIREYPSIIESKVQADDGRNDNPEDHQDGEELEWDFIDPEED